MRAIFNSLGSNYSFKFALEALNQVLFSNNKNIIELHEYLNKKFSGESYLFYKGRDAIEICFKTLFSEGKIMTQAFSCFAVEEGIKRAGLTPIYVDIKNDSTNMSVENLKKVYKKNINIKAVLVQHSLGIPAEIEKIKKWCDKNNLMLIEDLAQSIGGTDGDGNQLGKNADAIILSFGRDKVVDAVAGGAVVFKKLTEKQSERLVNFYLSPLPRKIFFIDMLYPMITCFGRATFDVLIGKIVFKLAIASKLIESPTISKLKQTSKMSGGFAKLALMSLRNLDRQLVHRRNIASYYLQKIDNSKIGAINNQEDVDHGTNLRFSIRTKQVKELIAKFKDKNIHLSDRWYRSPVDCGKQKCNSVYKKGYAVNAEKLVNEIINLPTHRNISIAKADRIIKVINEF